jgi:hypothetical protein
MDLQRIFAAGSLDSLQVLYQGETVFKNGFGTMTTSVWTDSAMVGNERNNMTWQSLP